VERRDSCTTQKSEFYNGQVAVPKNNVRYPAPSTAILGRTPTANQREAESRGNTFGILCPKID
jgi:hypothetical protein